MTVFQDLLHAHHLSHYRVGLADEQIDLETLGMLANDDDEQLMGDFNISHDDLATFRNAIAAAAQAS